MICRFSWVLYKLEYYGVVLMKFAKKCIEVALNVNLFLSFQRLLQKLEDMLNCSVTTHKILIYIERFLKREKKFTSFFEQHRY